MSTLAGPEEHVDLSAELERRGVSRRSFLKFCATMSGVLALPPRYAPDSRRAPNAPRIPVIWLNGQTAPATWEALLRANKPTGRGHPRYPFARLPEVLMAAAGTQAEPPAWPRGEVPQRVHVVVEGSIPGRMAASALSAGAFRGTVKETASAGRHRGRQLRVRWRHPCCLGGITGAVGVSGFIKDKKSSTFRLPDEPGEPTATIVST
jgi:hydrogenase small subunit